MTEQQIKLDQCTGHAVIQMRANVKTLEASYQRLRIYRGLALAVCFYPPLCPEALEGFNLAYQVEREIHLVLQAKWMTEKTAWLGRSFPECEIPIFSRVSSYPAYPFPKEEPLAYELGSLMEEDFKPEIPDTMAVSLQYKNLNSASELAQRGRKHEWKIRWTQ